MAIKSYPMFALTLDIKAYCSVIRQKKLGLLPEIGHDDNFNLIIEMEMAMTEVEKSETVYLFEETSKPKYEFHFRRSNQYDRLIQFIEVHDLKWTEISDRVYSVELKYSKVNIKHMVRLIEELGTASKKCPRCSSTDIVKNGKSKRKQQVYLCKTCGRKFI